MYSLHLTNKAVLACQCRFLLTFKLGSKHVTTCNSHSVQVGPNHTRHRHELLKHYLVRDYIRYFNVFKPEACRSRVDSVKWLEMSWYLISSQQGLGTRRIALDLDGTARESWYTSCNRLTKV